jgi:CubicO group peptidase (beta-lactamase class C family)
MKAYFFVFCIFLIACDKDETQPKTSNYFPDVSSWETKNPKDLAWDESKINELYQLLEKKNTKGFIVLKDGKIVLEKYWGKDLIGIQNFNQNSLWYWASAGKTLTAALMGIAEQENLLNLNEKTSKYLGTKWTSLSPSQEDKILIKNHLSMTTGLNDQVANSGSFEPKDFQYKSDAGTRWAYHNGPYTILDQILTKAVKMDFDTYFKQNLASKIGMVGEWRWVGNNHVYFSNARSMARFGLLVLNQGVWNSEMILNKNYLASMIKGSQELNKSYGYLWWLNGKESFMLPQSQVVIKGNMIPNGPNDMVMGLGKDGQFLCVVPSQNLVLVRLGNDPDESLVPITFLNEIWALLNDVIR